MDKKLKISIITVAYNSADTIEQTIRSVIKQKYPHIEYIIIDGGSKDGTVDIIKKYEQYLTYWVSESDNGMYDALVKGLAHVTGDICAYINSDDFYQPGAFEIVNEIFANHTEVKWLTGISTVYNIKGNIISAETPFKYRREIIKKGGYNGIWFPFIQQESTFWRIELLESVDYEVLRHLKLAGDYYLWKCFADVAEFDVIMVILSGFRKRKGQLSGNLKSYLKEQCEICATHLNIIDYFVAVLDRLQGRIPKWTNSTMFIYNVDRECWERNMSIMRRVRYYYNLLK